MQHPPLGGYVCSPFRAIFKPPLEVVVLTLKKLDELNEEMTLIDGTRIPLKHIMTLSGKTEEDQIVH